MTRTHESAADDTAVFAAAPPADGADLEETDPDGADLDGADLDGADLDGADPDGRDDGLAAALAKAAPRRWWNRGTLVLGALGLLLGGFLGGVLVQKSYGTTATATNRQAGFSGLNRGTGSGGYSGFAGGAGYRAGGAQPAASPAAAGTTGTVKLIDGNTIYVQAADGTVVTIRTTGKTTVRTSARGALKDVKAGDTVTVQGSAAADGTVTATAVTADRK